MCVWTTSTLRAFGETSPQSDSGYAAGSARSRSSTSSAGTARCYGSGRTGRMAGRRQRRMASNRAATRIRVVVTAGPTREHLDDVRFLSNGSTGAMGIELARAARARGADVTLVLGPTHLAPPPGVRTVRVTTTDEMLAAARRAAARADLVFFAAAPADWRPAQRRAGKPAK